MNDRNRHARPTREDVEKAVEGVEPDEIWDLAAGVNGRWFPVKQPITLALGISHRDINSRQAWRILRRLGLPVHDKKVDGPLPEVPGSARQRRDAETRKIALAAAAEVNRGTAASADVVLALADALDAWLSAA